MERHTRQPARWRVPVRQQGLRALAALLALIATLLPLIPTAAAEDFGDPTPGRRVYDQAGILTPTEVTHVELAAARVAAAGAPTIVYIRASDADQDETRQEAANLMEDWAVESSLGAKDGLVLFFNTDPDDLGHGEVALWAGETLSDGGNLPQRELERIFDDVIRDPMRDEQTAVGLAAGLDAAAHSLEFGPPPPPEPSELQETAATVARWPLGILGVGGALAALILMLRPWRSRPAAAIQPLPTTELPERLPPAVAGALVTGSAGAAQAQGTMLDLASRGAIAFEPADRGAKKRQQIQILLVDESLARTPYEQEVWRALAAVAEPSGVIPAKRLSKLRGAWKAANATLRQEMEERGWWDPRVGERRRPLYLIGALALGGAVIAAVVAIVGQEPLGLIGTVPLGAAGLMAVVLGASYPAATAQGATAAAPWRGLQSGLKQAKRSTAHLDLDVLLPYAMAMGEFGTLQKRLQAASADGYVPLAFQQGVNADAWSGGFYPYFLFFTTTSSPATSGSSSVSAGGAAAGGSGAGGSV